jgi:hypothetical protein
MQFGGHHDRSCGESDLEESFMPVEMPWAMGDRGRDNHMFQVKVKVPPFHDVLLTGKKMTNSFRSGGYAMVVQKEDLVCRTP